MNSSQQFPTVPRNRFCEQFPVPPPKGNRNWEPSREPFDQRERFPWSEGGEVMRRGKPTGARTSASEVVHRPDWAGWSRDVARFVAEHTLGVSEHDSNLKPGAKQEGENDADAR